MKLLLLPKDPNDAKNVSGEETATVTIKIRNKKTRVIGATNIAFINTPDGFNAKSITQLVQTTVRASATDIDTIAANNLRVVADLSEYTQAGTYQVPVTIYIDGYHIMKAMEILGAEADCQGAAVSDRFRNDE